MENASEREARACLEDMEAQDLRRAAERESERWYWSRMDKRLVDWGIDRANKKYFDARVPSGRGATSVGRGSARCF